MKKLILLLFIPLVSFGQILYGLKKTENGSTTIPFDVVNIDPLDGSTSIVLSTNSLIGVAAGASTYDQMNSKYICWGYDDQNNQNLYVMDLANLQTEISAFNSYQAVEMEYDLQNQKTYGLWWDGTAENFGEVNLSTGLVSSISTLPGVEAVAIGNSTFDSNNGKYIFIGLDADQYKLYTIDASTGTIINSPTIWQNGNRYSALEFNNQNGKLYGLFQDTDYEDYSQSYGNYYTDLRLAEIDLISGSATIIDSQTTVIGGYLTGYNLGGLCFDQQSQTYIIKVQNETSANLKFVYVSDAEIFAATRQSTQTYFYELQVDNMPFALDAYNLSSYQDDESILENITIYPNPSSSFIYTKSNTELDASAFDVTGKLIMSEYFTTKLDISQLEKGPYILNLSDGVNTSTHKIIKE